MSIIRSDHDQPDAVSASASTTRPPAVQVVRPLVMRLHFYAGLFIAPFLIVAAISGGLYAIAPTAEQWVYRDLLHTDSTGPAAPLAEQVRVAQTVVPDLQVDAVRPAAETGQTTRVLFADPSLGPSERMAVFIDPVTAAPKGTEVAYGSSGSLPMRTWISQLHRNLHLGEPGRIYSELAASWLWVIALGGLVLWVIRYRSVRRSKGSAPLLTIDRTSTGRNRTLNWHGAVGAWIVVGLVFLSATGLTWSRYAGENISDLRQSLSWTTPAMNSSLSPDSANRADSGHQGHGGADHGSMSADQQIVTRNVDAAGSVLSTARAVGVTGPVEMTIPSDADTAMVVSQVRAPWQLETNSVAIDPATETIVDASRFSEWPLAAKLSSWGIALHMGLLFGLANQLVLLAVAVGLVSLCVRGYLMWWRRRPTRGRQGLVLARAPGRGALRKTNPAIAIAVIAAAVLVGWFIPLLGISLLAFVAIDTAIGILLRDRARRTPPVSTPITTKGA
ncbi:PepSY-associated TM helix domain-containing protein [Gordonia rubripertincta]|uniref:PepSY-associated TM helix domain-containing protein n=1 Tax=Gordonia rubripertincta TaxID=36822 RepID=A0ABT4N3N5_GORRU|nr:PepSY-associated TM helix domain-containing protein [Gordonia rubripertincta]MCZ4553006.1 PepSY-associated TM helix domain-containing protein [Gordonia rubripertincta]